MYKQQTVVKCDSGLYNEQVTYFVQKANEFRCNIWLEYGNKKMNAKSLLGIMSMCIGTGADVTVSADGPEEQEAVTALCDMLQRDLF
ncbi:MAG: HPr family phosphocarrier protein [Candidatus Faecousia sp.]|nr:HPr family phosphocarrier protein [Clostridiales bacterium]MDD7650941.1 HPr family phosphocarrier protein [Bacillota bacterium]MDY4220379.1 HPr family phosphocarrier protein [Candidatus Faecousia sp.]